MSGCEPFLLTVVLHNTHVCVQAAFTHSALHSAVYTHNALRYSFSIRFTGSGPTPTFLGGFRVHFFGVHQSLTAHSLLPNRTGLSDQTNSGPFKGDQTGLVRTHPQLTHPTINTKLNLQLQVKGHALKQWFSTGPTSGPTITLYDRPRLKSRNISY